MRLFFAFDLPTEQARQVAALVPPRTRGVRTVAADRMHVTLRYVGSISPEARDRLADGLGAMGPSLGRDGLTVRVEGVGVFPGRRRARVLWAGLSIHEELVRLQRSIESLCRSVGLADEETAWHPHMTLARFGDGPPPWLDDFLDRHADLRLPPFPVSRITLYDSRTLESGPEYTPVVFAGR